MKARNNKTRKLRDMSATMALNHCVALTREEWIVLDDSVTVSELWPLFGAYIANGYNDTNLAVPGHIEAVWSRCKVIIDREAGV